MKVFETCFLYASTGLAAKIIRSKYDDKILFSYKVLLDFDSSIQQNVCIFIVIVYVEDETFIFAFGISEDYPDIGISVMKVQGNKTLHLSDVCNVEDLEARLFQIETIVDVHDLDTTMIDKMHKIREIYLKQKDETVLNNMV
ncbi:hypothetical protein [Yersinia phage fHe-Yen9-04]|uniref:Uncharacterized protein n=1 Tax=Yersinia phage fHe-Yen9-04 TaxID=2052742 RepID=A0A2C9CY25_9CAUD|nr:hypothetical protein FDJ41_gp445 [Yersinia phage fHe-Yen9-04]SOK58735.1 hypothetical protein [Yersinia phage fHe-Yen9-04]VUE36504.1 hypothetical protein [Yersinia phage fHe-Yen9-04]